jgi:hypothetical protein
MALGWGQLAGGIGELLGKASTYIPGRIEKLKNEKIKLEEERSSIEILKMDINNPEHRKKAKRLTDVIARIKFINGVLGSNAKD